MHTSFAMSNKGGSDATSASTELFCDGTGTRSVSRRRRPEELRLHPLSAPPPKLYPHRVGLRRPRRLHPRS